jgi:hypothetical protein
MSAPTIKQSLADLVSQRFPWLLHFVYVAGSKGKGLAIRAGGMLIHLAGGPDDPAVHRKGDGGTAGTIEILGAPGAGTGFKWTAPNGVDFVSFSFAFSGGAVVVSIADQTGPLIPGVTHHDLATKSTEGSDWVTCK